MNIEEAKKILKGGVYMFNFDEIKVAIAGVYNESEAAINSILSSIYLTEDPTINNTEDEYLIDFLNSAKRLKVNYLKFEKLYNDFTMEVEESEREKWEKEQEQIENDYYGV